MGWHHDILLQCQPRLAHGLHFTPQRILDNASVRTYVVGGRLIVLSKILLEPRLCRALVKTIINIH